jgi:hypothetical protein
MENLQLAKQIRRTIEANKGILPQELQCKVDDDVAALLNRLDGDIMGLESILNGVTDDQRLS